MLPRPVTAIGFQVAGNSLKAYPRVLSAQAAAIENSDPFGVAFFMSTPTAPSFGFLSCRACGSVPETAPSPSSQTGTGSGDPEYMKPLHFHKGEAQSGCAALMVGNSIPLLSRPQKRLQNQPDGSRAARSDQGIPRHGQSRGSVVFSQPPSPEAEGGRHRPGSSTGCPYPGSSRRRRRIGSALPITQEIRRIPNCGSLSGRCQVREPRVSG